jgi:hypothetical protein
MEPWLDANGRFFNPQATLRWLRLKTGAPCCVIDNALANPGGLAEWAKGQRYSQPTYPYPGVVCEVPPITALVADFFAQHIRSGLAGRRTLSSVSRLSMVTMAPHLLAPRQWQCHRDRVEAPPADVVLAASVLYLFHDAELGGTSFYAPRQTPEATDQMILDSQILEADAFSARYGLKPGYMAGSNAYFVRTDWIEALWNRMIFYDGDVFHSGDVGDAQHLSADPARGRLTLNSFFACKRSAQ